jgi:peptidoglycan L-alanyl-D-glutamate endopeptidase CwlK
MTATQKIAVGVSASVALLLVLAFLGRRRLLAAHHEAYLQQLHPEVQDKFRELVAAVEGSGYHVIITSGYRSFEKQAALHKENSANAQAGRSPHNYGLALDLNLQKGVGVWRKSTTKKEWENTGVPALAKSLGFRWGGNFTAYYDPVHFDTLPAATATAYMDSLYQQAQAQLNSDIANRQLQPTNLNTLTLWTKKSLSLG